VVQRSIVVLWSVLASGCAVGVEENPFDVQADGASGVPPASADDEGDGESEADESTGDAPASSGDTTGSDDAALGTSGDDSSASEDDGGGPAATTEPPPSQPATTPVRRPMVPSLAQACTRRVWTRAPARGSAPAFRRSMPRR
jgi:hypothetical protein